MVKNGCSSIYLGFLTKHFVIYSCGEKGLPCLLLNDNFAGIFNLINKIK